MRGRKPFHMHPRFYMRLQTLYKNPKDMAFALRDRTASQRDKMGLEVPKPCTHDMEVAT